MALAGLDDHRALGAVGGCEFRLALEVGGHRAVADLMAVADVVGLDQFGGEGVAAAVAFAPLGVDVDTHGRQGNGGYETAIETGSRSSTLPGLATVAYTPTFWPASRTMVRSTARSSLRSSNPRVTITQRGHDACTSSSIPPMVTRRPIHSCSGKPSGSPSSVMKKFGRNRLTSNVESGASDDSVRKVASVTRRIG